MKFEIIYSRKIRDAVAVFTIFMFICQYGLTREDVRRIFQELHQPGDGLPWISQTGSFGMRN